MDEIEYKLESGDPVLISHAVSKLFDAVKKKRGEHRSDHVSKIAEFKLLLAKKDSENATLGTSVCQALIGLVEAGLWDIDEALSTFASSVSTIKSYTAAATSISRLLVSDMKRGAEMYPFKLHAPQHPFVSLLTRDRRSWQTVYAQMTFLVDHEDPRIRESAAGALRPVFLYLLCDPASDGMDFCLERVWRMLIESKRGTGLDVLTEVLLWLSPTENSACSTANRRVLELAEAALAEGNGERGADLVPMLASLAIRLLKQGCDPRENFHAISSGIAYCDGRVADLVTMLMAELLLVCPAMYLSDVLRICTAITDKTNGSGSGVSSNALAACLLKWLAYPSALCSEALDAANGLASKIFAGREFADKAETFTPKGLLAIFAISDPYVRLYTELGRCLPTWEEPAEVLSWLQAVSRCPADSKDGCKLLVSGILLRTVEPRVAELCCDILVDVSRERKAFGSHVLSLVLHKLTKCRSSRESQRLLLVIPELATSKENIPVIGHTLDTLLNGDKQLKYFAIELYLRALRREPRCYRFVSTAIVRSMRSDRSWYSDASCASAISYICEHYPEHGEKLVPLISQILNRAGDANGGTACALALRSISALCRASVIDVSSTWKVLAPKMEKERRGVVLDSLCSLLADVVSYRPARHSEEDDRLLEDVASRLWSYATCPDARVAESALNALASYRLEQIPLRTLPAEFRRDLALPAAYAKTTIYAAGKPEDMLPYVPGTCWIEMLRSIGKATLPAAGNLLISFIEQELDGFRSGVYAWPQGEPQNFKYLPERSVIRAVGEYLRRFSTSEQDEPRILAECLRIFAHRYAKPLPNVNWSFLDEAMPVSSEAKRYALSIVCRHAPISVSARALLQNYLTARASGSVLVADRRDDESSVLYANLEYLCQAVQSSYVKPFLESTLEHVIEKTKLDNEDSFRAFDLIMSSYGRALKDREVRDANASLLAAILERLFAEIDLTQPRFRSFLVAALALPTKHLERIASPKLWWEITESKLMNAIAIRAELVLGRADAECPLAWLNEIIDEAASADSSVQTYFLEVVQRVQTEMRPEKSGPKWLLDLATQIQALLMESAKGDRNDRVEFYCDVLLVSVLSLSGIDSMLMKREQAVKVLNVRAHLFPQALAVLSHTPLWKPSIPQVMEWVNYMRTSNVPAVYRSMFHRSLICLRHDAHYKDAWTKYLSTRTEIDIEF